MESKGSQKIASNSEPVNLAFECIHPPEDTEGKAPIIFLHGITASKNCWGDIPQFVANKTKREVYAVDLRHHGESPWSETFEFDSNILDLDHFIETRQMDKVVLVGHSMGGMIAMNYAAKKPAKVEKLVVEDATIGRIPELALTFLETKLSIAKASINEVPDELDFDAAYKLLPKIMMEKVPEILRQYARFDEKSFILKKENGKFTFKANIDGILAALKNLPSAIPKPQGVYEGPACFIYGKNSPFNVESDEDIIKGYFPRAELIGVKNAGHTVHNDCRSEFKDILLNFLQNGCVARL